MVTSHQFKKMTEYAGTVHFAWTMEFVHVDAGGRTAYPKYYHFYATLSLTAEKNN